MEKKARLSEKIQLDKDSTLTLVAFHDGVCRMNLSTLAVDVVGAKPVINLSFSIELRPETLRAIAELADRVADLVARPAPKVEETVDLPKMLEGILLAPYKKPAVS